MQYQVTNNTRGPRLIFHAGEGNVTGGTTVARGETVPISMTKAEAENAKTDGLLIVLAGDVISAPGVHRVHFAVANDASGAGMWLLDVPTDKFVGIAVGESAPTDPSGYRWQAVTIDPAEFSSLVAEPVLIEPEPGVETEAERAARDAEGAFNGANPDLFDHDGDGKPGGSRPDDGFLMGSSVLPAHVVVGGILVQLGGLVLASQRESGLSSNEWNDLDEAARDERLAATLARLANDEAAARAEIDASSILPPPPAASTPKAVHRGAGSYSVMDGDVELVEKLNKSAAEEFNALDAEGQATFIADRTKAAD